MTQGIPVLTALALLAGAGVMVTATAYAQTSGGDRRDDRRDTRQGSRAQKQACKAGDEKSRSDCRQEKRDTKHGNSPPASSPTAPTATPTPPASSPTPPASSPTPPKYRQAERGGAVPSRERRASPALSCAQIRSSALLSPGQDTRRLV